MVGILVGILAGLLGSLVTGGGILDLSLGAIADDVILWVIKRAATTGVEASFVDQVALSVALDELIKITKRGIADQQDYDDEDRTRDHQQRYERHSPLVISGQLDIYDPLLLWWSSRTLLESDIAANAAGILGDAVEVL